MRPGGLGGLDIWVAQRDTLDSPWGPPVNLGPTINSSAADHCPLLTPDSHHLIFVSTRPGGFGGNDLYIAWRRDARDDFAWGSPVNLGATINSPFTDFTPGFFEEEGGSQILYFASNRPGGFGGQDVYMSVGLDFQFGPAVHVPELSTPADDLFPMPRRDGLELFLTSNRPGSIPDALGAPSNDLWVSTRPSTAHPWGAPVNMGPAINTGFGESRGAISFSRTILVFFSDRPGGVGGADLYQTTREKLTGPPP
ncbi:MAG TPA: hypothetical protein VNI83_12535 [Vicinamibacterales bacterium]|nr:hypothetical protein [Vicinamibacterales bacterium]